MKTGESGSQGVIANGIEVGIKANKNRDFAVKALIGKWLSNK